MKETTKSSIFQIKKDKPFHEQNQILHKKTFKQNINEDINKQSFKQIIMDYIARNIQQQCLSKKMFKKKNNNSNLKSFQYSLDIKSNKQNKCININALQIVENYLKLQKKNIYRQTSIKLLVIDILNFINQLQQIANNAKFQRIKIQSMNIDTILQTLINLFHKQKQKATLEKQIFILKSVPISNGIGNIKYVKQIQSSQISTDKMSFPVSIDNRQPSLLIQNNSIKSAKGNKPSISKLRNLLDKFQIFQHPQKIQQLRKQKLIEVYSQNSVNQATLMQKNFNLVNKEQIFQNFNPTNSKKYAIAVQCVNFLQNWIDQIGISEKLYKSKFESSTQLKKSTGKSLNKITENAKDKQQLIREST